MFLKQLSIANFRSMKELSLNFGAKVNLLIGPNASGKTSILEAIRLAKGLLAPRSQNEGRSILSQLGALSANLQALNYGSLANDPSKSIEIECVYQIGDSELAKFVSLQGPLSTQIAAANSGITTNDVGQTGLIQFLSTAQGEQLLRHAQTEVSNRLSSLATSRLIELGVRIDPATSRITGKDSFSQLLFSTTELTLPPYESLFSYFPADRALPLGEQPIQFGAADAMQQLDSHNSTPATKYQRLKNTIFSAYLQDEASRLALQESFRNIFRELLIGREIYSLGTNQYGQASVAIKDIASGKIFDIDAMSSGEKGLILTFLLMSKSISRGGVLLLDEPELHLNSAVCRRLLDFLIERYLEPKNIQAIICSHSTDILSSALRRDDCHLFHIQTGKPARETRKQDQAEVAYILRLLGAPESETMLYEGIVFVEGPDDVDLLETAFRETLSRYKYRQLSGRNEVEKRIKKLQQEELNNASLSKSIFFFDHDGKPTSLQSTEKVRVHQWSRYCLENFLLDSECIYDLLKTEFGAKTVPENIFNAEQLFYRIAKRQLRERVAREVFDRLDVGSTSPKAGELNLDTVTEIATSLDSRLSRINENIARMRAGDWKTQFTAEVNARVLEMEQQWRNTWQIDCDGKRFLRDLRTHCQFSAHLQTFKRRLLLECKVKNGNSGTEGWTALKSEFEPVIM